MTNLFIGETVADALAIKQGALRGFRREHRYYVVKRKHLTSEQEEQLTALLSSFNLPPLRTVVVEDDWPEYEAVWRMIETRCSAPPVDADVVEERKLIELLYMWRKLVVEGGVPRYTVIPGAALNTLVGWTDAALRGRQPEQPVDKDPGS